MEDLERDCSCGVCYELCETSPLYDTRTPMNLPCGHTFCRPCIRSLQRNVIGVRRAACICSLCEKKCYTHLDELSVNYAVLSVVDSLKKMQTTEAQRRPHVSRSPQKPKKQPQSQMKKGATTITAKKWILALAIFDSNADVYDAVCGDCGMWLYAEHREPKGSPKVACETCGQMNFLDYRPGYKLRECTCGFMMWKRNETSAFCRRGHCLERSSAPPSNSIQLIAGLVSLVVLVSLVIIAASRTRWVF